MRNGIKAVMLALTLCAGCHSKRASQADRSAGGGAAQTAAPLEAVNLQPASNDSSEEGFKTQLALAVDGLVALDGSTGAPSPIRFGSNQGETIEHVQAVIGNATGEGKAGQCPGGPMATFDYPGGITLFFQNKQFVGWDFDGEGHYTTMLGVGIGSTYGDLQSVGPVDIKESNIGHEFSTGGLHGLLGSTTPLGKVTNLWAGATCPTR